MSSIRFAGLDVHADTIAVAVAEPGEEVRTLSVIPNRPDCIRLLVNRLGPAEHLRDHELADNQTRGYRSDQSSR